MTSFRLDLLLGSDIGRWIVEIVDPDEVGSVVTRDDEIAAAAAARGIEVARAFPPDRTAPRALSAHWPALLGPSDLARYDVAYNIHPGLLPWGRGYAPVFWAIWAGEPAGATLHVMTPGLDKGPVVDRRPVAVQPDDTGWSLYGRVLEARKDLFRAWWPRLVAGDCPAGPDQDGPGSYHARAEFIRLRDEPDVSTMSARDLVRLCRALAMPGMPGPRVGERARLAYTEEGQ